MGCDDEVVDVEDGVDDEEEAVEVAFERRWSRGGSVLGGGGFGRMGGG